MAITFTLGTNFGSDTDTTSYTTASFTPAANDLLVVSTLRTASPTVDGTLTDSQGGTYTLITSALTTGATPYQQGLWVRTALASGVAHTITHDCTGDAATGCSIVVFRVAGMTRTGASAVVQTGRESDVASTTMAPSFDSGPATTTNACLGVSARSLGTVDPPTGWTEMTDTHITTSPRVDFESVYRVSGETNQTISWNNLSVSAKHCCIIAELDITSASTVKTLAAMGVG